MKKGKKVLLAIPVFSKIENDTVKSIWELDVPNGIKLDFNYCAGYTVGLARNGIVDYALENKYDYVLWIDSDVVVPKDLLTRLLKVIKDNKDCGIATGYYIKKIPGTAIAELFDGNDEVVNNIEEKDLPKDKDIMEVKACGFGCCLTSCKLLKDIKDKYGMCFEYIVAKQSVYSEDLNFCLKTRAEGKKIYADVKARCGHVGRVIF